MSLRLHPKLGVNPRLSVCPECGKDSGIILLGIHDQKITCAKCGCVNYGAVASKNCGRCNEPLRRGQVEQIAQSEKLVGELCNECLAEADKFNAVAEEAFKTGGCVARCKKCGWRAVLAGKSEACIKAREKMNLPAPKPLGIEYDGCPSCQPAGGPEKTEPKA